MLSTDTKYLKHQRYNYAQCKTFDLEWNSDHSWHEKTCSQVGLCIFFTVNLRAHILDKMRKENTPKKAHLRLSFYIPLCSSDHNDFQKQLWLTHFTEATTMPYITPFSFLSLLKRTEIITISCCGKNICRKIHGKL